MLVPVPVGPGASECSSDEPSGVSPAPLTSSGTLSDTFSASGGSAVSGVSSSSRGFFSSMPHAYPQHPRIRLSFGRLSSLRDGHGASRSGRKQQRTENSSRGESRPDHPVSAALILGGTRFPPHRDTRTWVSNAPAPPLAKVPRFGAQIGVRLWNWPCGHQSRPPESKDSRSAKTRLGSRLRGAQDSCGASLFGEDCSTRRPVRRRHSLRP